MVAQKQLEQLVNDLVASFPQIEKIILFGSYAYGRPTPDSDVDLLVLMEHDEAGYRAASRLRLAIDSEFPLDLLVRSPLDVVNRLEDGDRFIEEIIFKGVVLYENEHPGMDRESGSGFRRRNGAAQVAQTATI